MDTLQAGRVARRLVNSAFVASVLVLAPFATGCTSGTGPGAASANSDNPMIGVKAPDFDVPGKAAAGEHVTLADASGKVTIVDFWATWCAPCKESFPAYEKLHKEFGDQVQIIGLSVDDDPSGIADFAKDTGATFELGWDKGQAVAGRYKVGTMPTSYIIDQNGIIRFVHAGFHGGDEKQIEKDVKTLLN